MEVRVNVAAPGAHHQTFLEICDTHTRRYAETFLGALIRYGLHPILRFVSALEPTCAMNVFDLPPMNATLNGLSTCFIAVGWAAIRHLILAFSILPLVIVTVIPGLRARFDRHRRIGRFTMPIWLYVSIAGVIVYFMLYQWYPSTHFDDL